MTPPADGPTIDSMPELQAFLQRVERLRAEDLLARAALPADPAAHERATTAAADAARFARLDRTIDSAHTVVDHWVLRSFSSADEYPIWWEWTRPGTAADRVRLAHSLREAVTALLLGDRIDAADRDELLGAWADLVPDA